MTRIKRFLALSLALLLLLPVFARADEVENKYYNGFTYTIVEDEDTSGDEAYIRLLGYEWNYNWQYEESLIIPEEIEGYPVREVCIESRPYSSNQIRFVTIPKTVSYIQETSLNWGGIEEFSVDPDNSVYTSRNGILLLKDGVSLVKYPWGKKDTSLTLYGPVVITDTKYGFSSDYIEELVIAPFEGDVLPCDPQAFKLDRLQRFVVSDDDPYRYTVDGMLFDKKHPGRLVRCPAQAGFHDTFWRIPDGTTELGDHSVAVKYINCLYVPKSLRKISGSAFYDDYDKRTIFYEGSAEEWSRIEGTDIFSQSIIYYNYDAGATLSTGSFTDTIYWRLNEDGTLLIEGSGTLPRCSFENPEAVERIVIGEGIEKLEINSLAEFTEVRSIEISSTVTEIKGSFRENVNQKEFLVSENNPCYSNDAYGVLFNKDKSILVTAPAGISGTYQIPDTVREIGSSSFYGCTGLSEVKIPSSVQTISGTAFADCTGLERADLPDTLTSLGNGAFWNCTSLRSVSIPEGITVIPSAAFSHCTALTELTLPNTLTVIGGEAFYGCENLSGLLVIPDSVTEIQTSAFHHTGYSEVRLSDGLKDLSMCAFEGCRQLTSIVIPAGLERMGGHVFYGCSALKEVKIEAELTVIPWYVFYGCTSLKTIFLPASLQQIHGKAFENCTALTDVYFAGTEDAWNSLYIGEEGNECLKNAVVHCKAAPISDGWHQEDGKWFYYENGSHITGWKRLPDSHWYYFDETGVLQHGWLLDNGNWYYLNASGFMVTGWQKMPDGHWYYFNGSGILQHGWLRDGGNWYYLNASGFMVTGWQKLPDGNWYYFNGSGVLQHNWVRYSGNWYYLNGSGFMVTGWQRLPDGNWYYFDGSGIMQTGWLNRGGNWYYLNSSGVMETGWQYIGGSWYYFYPGGNMASSTTLTLGGTRYTFDASGRWVA